MAKQYNLPSLEFDASGSATIRFYGKMISVGLHYANAKTALVKMICPDSIDDNIPECNLCVLEKPSPRFLAMGWDCNKQRWVIYLAPKSVFEEISNKCKPYISAKMMEDGQGPDVILQRIGTKTEVEALPDTLGRERGVWKDHSNWDAHEIKDGKILPPPTHPDPITVFEQVRLNSHWRNYHSIGSLEKDYPKDGIKSYAQSQIIFGGHGLSAYSGSSGYSGYSGLGFTLAQASKPVPPSADLPVVKAIPKLEKKEKPEIKKIDDRWDVV